MLVTAAVHMKTSSLFKNRAKSRTRPYPGPQVYSSIYEKSAIELFMELMQVGFCTILKYDK